MFKKALIVIVIAVVGILAFAATKPDTFVVQRATTIKAPPEKIFPLIDDYRSWAAWSPWEKLDPTMKRTYSGPASGKGAVYAWEGTGAVGAGRMETTDSAPSSRVAIKLDFIKPFEAHNVVEFALEPKGDATGVTWTMRGPSPFVSKVMQVFASMDSMVGKDFESGLANLKAAAEK